ncbi:hypothetical protein [Rhodococcus ruber]|uniref:hypothetical protein n=1 Tax=Rhodococcus ruber TaxID=1830 RepID=UPI000C79A0D3|nr:hypothetical protein [Rhodococcus ruber]AUM17397.1 hypothetical protein CSW53_13245 [Rhodococcus ruber]
MQTKTNSDDLATTIGDLVNFFGLHVVNAMYFAATSAWSVTIHVDDRFSHGLTEVHGDIRVIRADGETLREALDMAHSIFRAASPNHEATTAVRDAS